MLSFDLGYRYSDYDLFGGQSTYKVGFELAPIDMVRFRGGYNRAVRVPNVGELFTPTSDGLWNGTDPCSGATPSLTAAQCANTGVTAAQYGTISASPASQYNAVYGGNPNLEPETADTITFGVVITPMDNLTFSIDYWDIEIEDVINNIGGELITEQCGLTGNPVFCNKVTRSATGSLWLGKTGKVNDVNVNQGSQKWTGIDLALSYNMEIGGGNLLLTAQGTMMDKKTTEPVEITNAAAAAAAYDCTGLISTDCVATPDWRSTVTGTFDFGGPVSASLKWRMMGEVDYDGTTDTIAQGNLSDQHYFDVTGAYQFNENIGFILGVNNILDEEPPLVGGTLTSNANVPNGNYDVLGRYWFTSVELKF
jgi:outer membrane receptor protein involved in Fe transport